MHSIQYLFLIISVVCVAAVIDHRVCVPKEAAQDCREMVSALTESTSTLECIEEKDIADCLVAVLERRADVVAVQPDDMYHASHIPNQDFLLIQEYRTETEKNEPFRYRAVMVIKDSLSINSLNGLRGLKTCHTGVNRNVGYRIPLTLLSQAGVLQAMNDSSISPKENELRALSRTFSKSCLVGKWSDDPNTNRQWKSRYSNLCELCERPSTCDYPDNYSGYEGALRCLARNGGDVAFTKEIFVNKFFGPGGEESPATFRYFCADGTRQSIANNENPCSWAARPWPGILAHTDILINLDVVRQKLTQLAALGYAQNTTWSTSVLGLSPQIHHVVNNEPISPAVYLTKANYFAVVDREHKAKTQA